MHKVLKKSFAVNSIIAWHTEIFNMYVPCICYRWVWGCKGAAAPIQFPERLIYCIRIGINSSDKLCKQVRIVHQTMHWQNATSTAIR